MSKLDAGQRLPRPSPSIEGPPAAPVAQAKMEAASKLRLRLIVACVGVQGKEKVRLFVERPGPQAMEGR